MTPQNSYYTTNLSAGQSASLLSRVSYLLASCLLSTAVTAYISRGWDYGTGTMCGIGAIVCVFALGFARATPGINLLLLFGLAALEGFALGPILNAYTHIYANGGQIIANAFTLTAACVGGIGAYIWISNKDFGFLGKFLFWGLLALLIVGVIGMFVAGPFASAQGQLIYCVIGAAIFVGYTLYDFSNIKHRYGPDDYVIATVSVYLDFLNLFMFLLRILGILSGSSRSRD